MPSAYNTTEYRYPNEQLVLTLTLFLVLVVIVVTATATLCGSILFVLAMLALSYWVSQSRHQALLKNAYHVTPETAPRLMPIVRESMARLQAKNAQVFVVPADVLNAYTFGLSDPKVVVLYSPILQVMDADEIQFVLGHELGHVRLGHTWLNSIVGGMAGIPSPLFASIILQAAFLWWNRMCEYSADRAGLLACAKPNKAISALVKLATGGAARTPADLQKALALIEKEDDDLANNIGSLGIAVIVSTSGSYLGQIVGSLPGQGRCAGTDGPDWTGRNNAA